MERRFWETAHLFSRAGFGATTAEIDANKDKPWSELVDLVFDQSELPALGPAPNLAESRDWHDKWVDMTYYWLDRARRPVTQAPIVEKMTLFWHGYLCSSLIKVNDHKMMFDQNQLFRANALGDVGELLWKTSIDPAMLRYLDNRLNTVNRLNENFSRELMELFITGTGHYSETDVRESARAWTGHGLDDQGRHRFSRADHDPGLKTFLGQQGHWQGRDIIDLLLARRRQAHARFFARKLWSFFAYPVALTDPIVSDIAATYTRNLNATEALRAVFNHSQFRSDQAMGGLLRSPVEYAVALMRHARLDCKTAHPEWYLKAMGQEPFKPPNVSGWRSNEYWVSESAVWARGDMAGYVRWRAYNRGDLAEVNEVKSWNPTVFHVSPEQAVDRALANYGLTLQSQTSRAALVDFVKTERKSASAWGQRDGLLFLTLMLPEMQLA